MKPAPSPDSVSGSRAAPIIERAPLPIVEVQGLDHTVTYVNPAFCALLGKKRSELVEKPFSEVVFGGDQCVPLLNEVYQTGEPKTLALPDETDPQPAFWLYAMWPALDVGEKPVGVIIQLTRSAEFRRNAAAVNEALLLAGLRQHELRFAAEEANEQLRSEIAAREQAEKDLKESQSRLAQANELLSHRGKHLESLVEQRTAALNDSVQQLEMFSYSIVHDMRAPLRSMQSFARLLEQEFGHKLDDHGRDYVRRIVSSSNRMDLLITDVLSYSRVAASSTPPRRVDLDRLVEEIVTQYPEFEEQAVNIHVLRPLPAVLGNTALLTQVISNLLHNAIRFTQPPRPPHITVRAEILSGAERVRLWVEDRGIGIAPEHHEQIFKLFHQLHTRDKYPGTGVGLAIVKKALERMHGTVGVESQLGQGSRFWVELTLAPRLTTQRAIPGRLSLGE
jgi:signal transduction histidine kinase